MEDMTIVFFYVDEKGRGRKQPEKKRFGRRRRSEEWQYNVCLKRRQMGDGSLKIFCVGLPLLENDQKWTCSAWRRYLKGLPVPPESRYVYYMPDKKAEQMLGRGREPIGIEWILALMEYYSLEFDGLVLVQDREMEAEELIRYYARELPYLGVVRDFMTDWEEVEESLSMEYGLTLDVQNEFEQLHIKGDRVLIVFGAGEEVPENATIKEGSILLFTEGRRKEVDRKRFNGKNVFIVDMERFLKDTVLDTVRKIKYNSTR